MRPISQGGEGEQRRTKGCAQGLVSCRPALVCFVKLPNFVSDFGELKVSPSESESYEKTQRLKSKGSSVNKGMKVTLFFGNEKQSMVHFTENLPLS